MDGLKAHTLTCLPKPMEVNSIFTYFMCCIFVRKGFKNSTLLNRFEFSDFQHLFLHSSTRSNFTHFHFQAPDHLEKKQPKNAH